MEIREISVSQMAVLVEMDGPIGLFYYKEGSDLFTGIDNSTGDAFIEQFRTLEECLRWLNRIEEELPMDIEEKQLIIFKHYGTDHQLDRLAEESAELIQVIMKLKKYRISERNAEHHNNFLEEMADVLNVVEQLTLAFGVKEEILEIQEMKLDREIERINEGKRNGI